MIRSFTNQQPLKHFRLWVSIYAGLVSIILVLLAFDKQGYTYDIRYAPVILVFAYLGPIPGLVTGAFALLIRLLSAGNWIPAIVGWGVIMLVFSILYLYIQRFSSIKKCIILFCSYIFIYIITIPYAFNIFRDSPLFHFQYLLFVMLGVIIGALLIESNQKVYRMNEILSNTSKMLETSKNELKHTLDELTASEFKYRLIAENTSDLIMVIEKGKFFSYFSPSHEAVLGYRESELKGSKFCNLLHPDDMDMFENTIQKLFDSKDSQSIECRFKHKENHWIYVESRCMSVFGENQIIEHVVIISRDISERKKSEEFLLQSEKLSIVGELAAGVAHEIRNPLTTIKGFVQLYKAEDRSIWFTDLLLSELERIETITSELLSLGKPQAIQLNREDLRALLENTLDLLLPQAHMSGIQFKRMFEDTSFPIICEKNQLRQVFLNILKNAIESMQNGGEILIDLQKGKEHECIITIQDSGCGIPEEILPRLGEPFYTLKEKGTGLGLMICNKIIKQHNGSITYKSKLKEGTVVEITLPLCN